ncbi:MAG: alpha-L-fucosidase [Planctomycetota bacterium]
MRSLLPCAAALALSCAVASQDSEAGAPTWQQLAAHETPQWFKDAKFGIFIHWGVYSVPSFCDTSTYSEWYQHWLDTNAHDGLERKFHAANYGEDFAYRDFAPMFRAEMWSPEDWAKIFRRAGARYVVLTSKHHDGFCLWPSAVASEVRGYPWNSGETGPKRDLVGELTEAVRAEGLEMGLYYSFMEWHSPLYDEDRSAYVTRVMRPQIEELITRYAPTVFWPDGEWNHPDSLWQARATLDWIYANHPAAHRLAVNDRWGKGLRGLVGDFSTTEYGSLGNSSGAMRDEVIFEECRGIGHSFAFNRAEGYDVYDTRDESVQRLIETVGRGGNLLLDIGPTADGRIPLIMVDRLFAIGRWLDRNGQAIYGTTAGPFRKTPWGAATTKEDRLFLHVYDWSEDRTLQVPGLRNDIEAAWLLHDEAKRPVPFTRDARGVTFDLSGRLPCEHATVLALQLDGAPVVDERVYPADDGSLTVSAQDARIEGKSLRVEQSRSPGEADWQDNLGYWSNTTDTARFGPLALPAGRYRIELECAVDPSQGGGALELRLGTATRTVEVTESTGSWQTYRALEAGTVEIGEGSTDLELALRAARIDRSALMNLRAVRLEPVR